MRRRGAAAVVALVCAGALGAGLALSAGGGSPAPLYGIAGPQQAGMENELVRLDARTLAPLAERTFPGYRSVMLLPAPPQRS